MPTSSLVHRSPGSLTKVFLIILIGPSSTFALIFSSAFLIFSRISPSFSPLNGNSPQTIVKSMTPSAQTSAGPPKYGILSTISGAMYGKVPQKSLSFSSNRAFFAKPKSMMRISRSSLTRTFSNFKSLWKIPWKCRKFTAFASFLKRKRVSADFKRGKREERPRFRRYSLRDVVPMNSRTRFVEFFVEIVRNKRIIEGFCKQESRETSVCKDLCEEIRVFS